MVGPVRPMRRKMILKKAKALEHDSTQIAKNVQEPQWFSAELRRYQRRGHPYHQSVAQLPSAFACGSAWEYSETAHEGKRVIRLLLRQYKF